MDSDQAYRKHLKAQIEEACGKVIYTYTAHHKFADRLENLNNRVQILQIILTAISAGGFFVTIITNQTVLSWIGGATAVISLGLNLYTKEYKIQNEVNLHRNAANDLWDVRESYVSLLTDFEILNIEDIRKNRDNLQDKVSEINRKYPSTDRKSYKSAKKSLQTEEEQTFNENEVASILPNGISDK